MAYQTTDSILGIVYGLLTSITVPKYIKTSPAKSIPKEYVVINSLPINADVMQKCIINVNYHVKDIGEGQPDTTRLIAGFNAIMNIMAKVTTTVYLIDFEGQETIREEARGEHYTNMRFSFKYINYN